jgi:hypothetical protein
MNWKRIILTVVIIVLIIAAVVFTIKYIEIRKTQKESQKDYAEWVDRWDDPLPYIDVH